MVKARATVIPAKEGIEKYLIAVIPAKAEVPRLLKPVDSCLRRNDGKVEILHVSTPSKAGIQEGRGSTLTALSVIPAKAGIPQQIEPMDPRFRGDDGH